MAATSGSSTSTTANQGAWFRAILRTVRIAIDICSICRLDNSSFRSQRYRAAMLGSAGSSARSARSSIALGVGMWDPLPSPSGTADVLQAKQKKFHKVSQHKPDARECHAHRPRLVAGLQVQGPVGYSNPLEHTTPRHAQQQRCNRQNGQTLTR